MRVFLKRTFSLVLAFLMVFSLVSFIEPINTEAAASQYVSSTVPSVYKTYINALKKAHPNWKFEFFYTGLKWSDVIAKETDPSVPDRSLISYVFPKSYRSIVSKSYNGSTDTYTSYDAGGWYMAAAETVSYYMDPRNFFTDVDIFQFEKLSYDEDIHTIDGVKAILKGSFMDGKKITNTSNKSILYAQAYIDAAKHSNVSPYHLAARTIQEVGKNGSGSTSGTYSKTYKGIYNFYNIGAYSGSNPIANGLKWASQKVSDPSKSYGRPWTSQYKSIVGGATYIGEGYINNKQNTLYLEKFDVVGEYNDTSLYTHQYMGNITAAYTEGRSVYSTYKDLGALDNAFTFVIPVYNSMPSKISPLPITADSPWSWLKSLKVDTYTLSPSSTLQVTTNNYTVTVPNSVKKVTISAEPYYSKATVSGIPVTTTTSVADTGKVVNVTSNLRVRTSAGVSSPDENENRLKYKGEYVGIKNGTAIKKLGEQTVNKTVWYKISFSYSGTTLKGWVSSNYIEMDTVTTSSYSKVSLKEGKNTYNIKVTSPSGSSRTYVLTITRQEAEDTTPPSEPTTNTDLFNTKYKVDEKDKFILSVSDKTSYSSFIKALGLTEGASATVKDGKDAVTKGNISTGMTLTVTKAGIDYVYKIGVIGDVNGDGETNILDIVKVRNHILNTKKISGVNFNAADINDDAALDIRDIVKIRNIILA